MIDRPASFTRVYTGPGSTTNRPRVVTEKPSDEQARREAQRIRRELPAADAELGRAAAATRRALADLVRAIGDLENAEMAVGRLRVEARRYEGYLGELVIPPRFGGIAPALVAHASQFAKAVRIVAERAR